MGHRLGPHVIGQRIVVRRRVPGERGPTGAPALTDVLGVCTAWSSGTAVIRREDDSEVSVTIADIVSGKPVPPRASTRLRISPRDAELRALALWPQLATAPLGAWTLRWSGLHRARRANSALAMGPAEVRDPVTGVISHYERLGRRPIAAVLPESDEEEQFRRRGWIPESSDADSLFQVAGVAAARRRLQERPAFAVTVTEEGNRVEARVAGAATGFAALTGDWLGLRSVEVAAERRRHGLGLAVVAALLDWAAERGAVTAYLQVLADNAPALGLYDRLGFTTHHSYRYLAR